MIELIDIGKKYSENEEDVCSFSLEGINLSFPKTGLHFIIGKSGSGKTTLLNIIGNQDSFSTGKYCFNGKNVDFKNSKIKNEEIGYIFQDSNLINNLNVEGNILLASEPFTNTESSQLSSLLKLVDLEGFEKRKVNTLSGGEKQRVAIARAIAKKPLVLLCDEPTGSLDSKNAKNIFELLKKCSENCLVIVVTHDEESALTYGDRIIKLSEGKIAYIKNLNGNLDKEKENIGVRTRKKCIFKKHLLSWSLKFFNSHIVRFISSFLVSIISLGLVGIFCSVKKPDSKVSIVLKNAEALNQKYIPLSFYDKYLYLGEEESIESRNFSEDEFVSINEELEKPLIGVKNLNISSHSFVNKSTQSVSSYYGAGAIKLDSEKCEEFGFELVNGTLPSNENEICISLFGASSFQTNGIRNSEEDVNINPTIDEIIGTKIKVNGEFDSDKVVTISGVIDTHAPDENEVKNKTSNLLEEIEYYKYNLHSLIFIYGEANSPLIDSVFYECALLDIRDSFESTKTIDKALKFRISYDIENLKTSKDFRYDYIYSFLDIPTNLSKNINNSLRISNGISVYLPIIAALLVLYLIILMFFFDGAIKYKKKDIAVIRSLGYKKKTILIHLSIVICFLAILFTVFACCGSLVMLKVINNCLISQRLEIFTFNFYGIASIFVSSIVCVFIAFLIPIFKEFKTKPIAIIKNVE